MTLANDLTFMCFLIFSLIYKMKTIIVSTLWGYCSNESSYRRWLEQYLAHTVFNKYQLLWEPLSFLRPPGEGPRQYDAVVPAAAGGLRTVRAGLWGTDQQQRQSGKKECKVGILWADSAPNGLASQRNVATASHSLILMASTHLFSTPSACHCSLLGRPKR